ncbi:von Willebrand factor type A domain-containing protein [Mycena epipterygia]|nr:von Willebrand factor type A domain-containing protein [Mycena epipterygia]
MGPSIHGLYYYYQQRVVSLPLLSVRAEASIKELAAQVKITQTYVNDAIFPIEAQYTFPIPARAAVSGFVMIKQDGTRIVGSVLEKQSAREAYKNAVALGQQASLMEQHTSDVFQISVGNIPSNEQVQIELVYATELSEDEENDSIRFHLPVHIGARYGQTPQSTPSFGRTPFISSSSKAPFLNIVMSVEAMAPISKIGCPSHAVSTELGPDPKLPNFKELPFSNYARVTLSSDSALDKDFVLAIKSAGLDTPRCIAELHPTHNTIAMGLTLVPRFKLPDLSRQEFVFLVDRSGSMRGQRIEAAKKALIVMLRALPHQESLFQIVSFGSWTTSLWEQGSKPYNQETLEEATRHVDGIQADYGGTEIRGALNQCFTARKLDRPTSVLMLTDGDAWDLDGVLSQVKSAVAAAPAKAYLRLSVLGIGNSASTAMCEGIARVGNGTCIMVGEQETFTGKIARMLKAARTPLISNISVDWGHPVAKAKVALPQDEDEFEIVEKGNEKKKTLNIFDESIDDALQVNIAPPPPPPAVDLPPPPAVQQAPFKIQNLFPNIRLNIYAILQGKTIPKTVIIRGSTADGAEIELPILVTLSHLQNAPGAPPAVHALSARKLIQDLEDGQHALTEALADPDDTDLLARMVKASIVRFGKTYSISSVHTSFVAVDESKPKSPLGPEMSSGPEGEALDWSQPPSPPFDTPRGIVVPRPRVHGRSLPSTAAAPPPAYTSPATQAEDSSFHETIMEGEGGRGSSQGGRGTLAAGAYPKGVKSRGRPAIASNAPAPSASSPSTFQDVELLPQRRSVQSTSTQRSVSPSTEDSTQGGARSYIASRVSAVGFRGFMSTPNARNLPSSDGPSPSSSDPLEALARLQSFDGCFSLKVLSVIKLNTKMRKVRQAFPDGATDGLVATVLVMAFLSAKLGATVDRDSWEGIYDKAQQYVEAALRSMDAVETVDVLEAKIAKMLA